MKNQELIEKLSNCVAHCLNCADACLGEEDVQKMVTCIRLDRQCAAICNAAIHLLSQNSGYAEEVITLCQKACTDCAEECHKHKDQHCQDCAKACRECADACSDFAA